MPVSHAYATFVRDQDTGFAAEVGTLSLSTLADQHLAGLLRDGNPEDFLGALGELEGEANASKLEVSELKIAPQTLATGDLTLILASALSSNDVNEAMAKWAARDEPDAKLSSFIGDLLDATVLAEQSDAAAIAAAAAVGAAAAQAEGSVVVALVTAGHIGGVALLVAGPAGIVVAGVGAAYVTWRLLTHRRRAR